MGARISVQFKNGNAKSAILNSHWGGDDFLNRVDDYVTELKEEQRTQKKTGVKPLDRLEPDTVMVDFVRWLTKDEARVTSDYRLVCSEDDIDNSDYGHHIIDLTDEL